MASNYENPDYMALVSKPVELMVIDRFTDFETLKAYRATSKRTYKVIMDSKHGLKFNPVITALNLKDFINTLPFNNLSLQKKLTRKIHSKKRSTIKGVKRKSSDESDNPSDTNRLSLLNRLRKTSLATPRAIEATEEVERAQRPFADLQSPLTSLELKDVTCEDKLAGAIVSLENLRSLSLKNIKHVSYLMRKIDELPMLRSLKIEDTPLTAKDLNSLKEIKTLNNLELKCNQLGVEEMKAIGSIYTLQRLRLSQSPLHGCLDSLNMLTSLEILGLSNCELDDSDLQKIAHLRHIQTLGLGNNPGITVAGITSLKSPLRYLILTNIGISSCDLPTITSYFYSLEKLHISGMSLSTKDIHAATHQRQNLQLIAEFCTISSLATKKIKSLGGRSFR